MMFATHHAWGEPDCYDEKIKVKQACIQTIKFGGAYKDPTDACKDVVSRSDMTCICSMITSEEETEISVYKFLLLARACNKPVKPGTTCGSK